MKSRYPEYIHGSPPRECLAGLGLHTPRPAPRDSSYQAPCFPLSLVDCRIGCGPENEYVPSAHGTRNPSTGASRKDFFTAVLVLSSVAYHSMSQPRRIVSMSGDRSATEKILNVLRPYASNWSGTLGRGDLVIPQREIPRLIHEILDAVREVGERRGEASEVDVFQVLNDARRLSSLQDQVERLRDAFLIVKR